MYVWGIICCVVSLTSKEHYKTVGVNATETNYSEFGMQVHIYLNSAVGHWGSDAQGMDDVASCLVQPKHDGSQGQCEKGSLNVCVLAS